MPYTRDDAPYTENEFEHLEELDTLYATYGKPIYICDHYLSFRDPELLPAIWYEYPDEESAAAAYGEYLKRAFPRPYIIGYGKCQFPTVFVSEGKKIKQGILKPDGSPYSKYLELVKPINLRILEEVYSDPPK